MYKGKRVLLIAPAHNEAGKLEKLVARTPWDIVDTFLVIDDASSDNTPRLAQAGGATVVSFPRQRGVGAAIRHGYQTAVNEGFDIAVVIAGNGKDDPRQIARLLDPICAEGCDFVMGSRFLEPGATFGDMPLYRRLATRFHPWLVGLFCRKSITESTNGFRALRVGVLEDARIDLDQPWLDRYELEVYLLMRVLQLGYDFREVPVTKIYPPKQAGQTKMKPGTDWWKMLKPIFLVGLRLRQ
jgi:dolichol-phosphate mannosyltransferase